MCVRFGASWYNCRACLTCIGQVLDLEPIREPHRRTETPARSKIFGYVLNRYIAQVAELADAQR